MIPIKRGRQTITTTPKPTPGSWQNESQVVDAPKYKTPEINIHMTPSVRLVALKILAIDANMRKIS